MTIRKLVPIALFALAAVAAAAVASGAGPASPGQGRGPDTYTIGLFGDMPYNALGKSQYPSLLADLNGAHVAFSVFDGDLKAGGDGACTDALYTTAIANFDPLERLAHERQLFASTDQSLGQKTLTLTRQLPSYPENVRWTYGPVVYLGLNVQGSNDNYPYAGVDGETRPDAEIARMRAEEVARKAADIEWLREGFAYAKATGAKGVLIVWQADPNFNNEQHLADARSWDALPDYANALRDETAAFRGQVALVHGDSHYFKVDKPLNGPSGGVLRNFTRVETFGARNTHWVSATIDPSDPNLFVFEPRLVAGND
jgi:hypothetical protein